MFIIQAIKFQIRSILEHVHHLKELVLLVLIWSAIFSPIPAKEVNNLVALQKGVNLGNTLEAPNYEGEWGYKISLEHLVHLKELGFDHVRLPIRWTAYIENKTTYALDSAILERVEEIVNWAISQQLKILIDVHHFSELSTNVSANEDQFYSIWGQIANHFQSYSDEYLFFELLNEPYAEFNDNPQDWNTILNQAITLIRQSNPTRTLIIGGIIWNSVWGLQYLELPSVQEDPYLVLTFHYYEPFNFTHQQAEWVDGADDWVNITWRASEIQMNQVRNHFALAINVANDLNRPLYLGEFGVYSTADNESRVTWTKFIRETAEGMNIGWAYWEYAAGFGFYDLSTQELDQSLYYALIDPSSETSSLTVFSNSTATNTQSVRSPENTSQKEDLPFWISSMSMGVVALTYQSLTKQRLLKQSNYS